MIIFSKPSKGHNNQAGQAKATAVADEDLFDSQHNEDIQLVTT